MSWLKALELFFKAKDVKDQVDEVAKLAKYADKVSKTKNPTWDDLKYFDNDQMTQITKDLREAEARADAALKADLEFPSSRSGALFFEALRLSDKHGHESPQVKAALETYRKELARFDKELGAMLSDLEAKQARLEKQSAQAGAIEKYARVLEDAFMKCAQIPSLGGTAQNAMFFSLAQDALQVAGIAGSLETKLGSLATKGRSNISECKDLIDQNRAWMKWAQKDAQKSPDTLKRNAKAETPR